MTNAPSTRTTAPRTVDASTRKEDTVVSATSVTLETNTPANATTSTSVPRVPTSAIRTPSVQTPKEAIPASVIKDTPEMENSVPVSKETIYSLGYSYI